MIISVVLSKNFYLMSEYFNKSFLERYISYNPSTSLINPKFVDLFEGENETDIFSNDYNYIPHGKSCLFFDNSFNGGFAFLDIFLDREKVGLTKYTNYANYANYIENIYLRCICYIFFNDYRICDRLNIKDNKIEITNFLNLVLYFDSPKFGNIRKLRKLKEYVEVGFNILPRNRNYTMCELVHNGKSLDNKSLQFLLYKALYAYNKEDKYSFILQNFKEMMDEKTEYIQSNKPYQTYELIGYRKN